MVLYRRWISYPQVQYVDVPGYAGFNEAPFTWADRRSLYMSLYSIEYRCINNMTAFLLTNNSSNELEIWTK